MRWYVGVSQEWVWAENPMLGKVEVEWRSTYCYVIRRFGRMGWDYWHARRRTWVCESQKATIYRYQANASRVAETLRTLEGLARL